MNFPEVWTRGLDLEDRQIKEEILKNSTKTLDIVRELVYNIYIDSLHSRVSDLENPAWPLKAAYRQGEQGAYDKLLKLLDIQGEDRSLQKTKKKALTR